MRVWAVALSTLWLPAGANADTLERTLGPRRGRVGFVFVGASMTDNQGLTNGVNCLKTTASAEVTEQDLPAGPKLVSATLYLGGSLIDDGVDYDTNPPTQIFSNAGQTDDPGAVDGNARAAADVDVAFHPPGADEPIDVTAAPGSSKVAVFEKFSITVPPSPEDGWVGFFATAINVTEAIAGPGRGILAGTYRVAGLLADVCNGEEAVCVNPPNEPICDLPHSNGAASFALLLVVEDPSYPLRVLSVYEGMDQISGKVRDITLDTGVPVSDPAAGSLAFYALEGDLEIGKKSTGADPCDAEEWIEVDGDEDHSQDGLCLADDDNPIGNIFNSSINVQARGDALPTCTRELDEQCCKGPGLCPVVGVDIDRFDISAALAPGATQIRVSLGSTGLDNVALGVVVLAVNVFEPVLAADTQIRAIGARDGRISVGGPLIYSMAISNTGNTPATGLVVKLDAPPWTEAFAVTAIPPGSVNDSLLLGGPSGTGQVHVHSFDVPAGEIAEVRFQMTTVCAALGRRLAPQAVVASNELETFVVDAETVTPSSPGVGACDHVEADLIPEPRSLRGGSFTCQSGGPGQGWLLSLILLLCAMHGRRRHDHSSHQSSQGRKRLSAMGTLLALVAFATQACADRRDPGNGAADDPSVGGPIASLVGLPGDLCSSLLRVQVISTDGSSFCIDRFEAAIDGAAKGDRHQGKDGNDASLELNDSSQAQALLALGALPAKGVSWYQAKAACQNAAKRLCTVDEWERACRGPKGYAYPYGDDLDDAACNGFFNDDKQKPASTGGFNTCGSEDGVYDMSGNLEEWTATAVDRIPGSGDALDRAVRGGSYQSNANALTCAGPEFHEPPGSVDTDRGFRCCSDGPL